MPLNTRGAVSEAVQTVKGTPVLLLVVAAIVACMSAAVLLTAGRAAALERDVLASVDDAGVRTITMTSDRTEGGLDPDVVDRIAQLDDVAWAIGLSKAQDVTNAAIPGGRPVASRAVYGQWRQQLHPTRGEPKPGAVLVSPESAELLGLRDEVGAVNLGEESLPVVGIFSASGPLSGLQKSVLRIPGSQGDAASVSRVYVVATSAMAVDRVAGSLVALSGEAEPETVHVQTSDELVQVRAAVSGQLTGFTRQLAAGALAVGLTLVALCAVMMSNTRRRDFGRRRALGASRGGLVVVVALTVLLPGFAGVAIGTGAGLGALVCQQQPTPSIQFILASAVLAVIATVAGAMPGALLAAWRDPARVLRVP